MPVPSWRTPKALYRMARRGGDPWTRVRDSFPPEQREELSRLNETVDALSAELKEARDVEEQKSSTISDRRRLRKPWEEARRTALEPSESFMVATGIVDILQSAPTRRFRPAELAEELDADANADDFLEAVQTVVAAGFAEWTALKKLRAVDDENLRSRVDGVDRTLAEMGARLRELQVAPMWMLHDEGSAKAPPTEAEKLLNMLFLRDEGSTWAGPDIVASTGADLESLEADQIWQSSSEAKRGLAEIEPELNRAKKELQEALRVAASGLWTMRETIPGPPDEGLEGPPGPQPEDSYGRVCASCGAESTAHGPFCTYCGTRFKPVRSCESCGAESETDGSFCPDCGAEYEAEQAPAAVDGEEKRSESADGQADPEKVNGARRYRPSPARKERLETKRS